MSPHAEIDNSTYASPEPSHYVAKAAAIAASAPAPTGSLKVHTIEKATDGVMRIKIRVRPSSLARHTLLIHGNGMDLEQEKLFATEIQFACDKDNGAHNRVCAFYRNGKAYSIKDHRHVFVDLAEQGITASTLPYAQFSLLHEPAKGKIEAMMDKMKGRVTVTPETLRMIQEMGYCIQPEMLNATNDH